MQYVEDCMFNIILMLQVVSAVKALRMISIKEQNSETSISEDTLAYVGQLNGRKRYTY